MASPYECEPFASQSLPVRRHRRTPTGSIRRAKSTPSLNVPRAPRYPPELDAEYLTRTVAAPYWDRPASHSSCALHEQLLCGDAGAFEIIIEPPSARGSISSSSFASSSASSTPTTGSSSASSSPTVKRRRARAKAAIRGAMDAVLGRLIGTPVRRAEERLAFVLCT